MRTQHVCNSAIMHLPGENIYPWKCLQTYAYLPSYRNFPPFCDSEYRFYTTFRTPHISSLYSGGQEKGEFVVRIGFRYAITRAIKRWAISLRPRWYVGGRRARGAERKVMKFHDIWKTKRWNDILEKEKKKSMKRERY